ncbi:MAG: flavodoxin family protein [Tissierellia bacterium]|nr:flavodoxin family protein [Tissierellia bacterium]
METLVLYDTTANDYSGVDWLKLLLDNLGPEHKIQKIRLDYNEISSCLGCFGCWTKTPGNCVIKEDKANDIARRYVNADVVVLLTQVVYGGYSPDIKAYIDRSICILSPFFTMIKGEMHHQKRYEKYPELYAFGYGKTTAEEKEIFANLSNRNALNLYSLRNKVFVAENKEEMVSCIKSFNNFLIRGDAI